MADVNRSQSSNVACELTRARSAPEPNATDQPDAGPRKRRHHEIDHPLLSATPPRAANRGPRGGGPSQIQTLGEGRAPPRPQCPATIQLKFYDNGLNQSGLTNPTRTTRRWSLPKRKELPPHAGGHAGAQYPDTKKPSGEPEGF